MESEFSQNLQNQIPIGLLITEVCFLPDDSAELFWFWYYKEKSIPGTREERRLLNLDLAVGRCCKWRLIGSAGQIEDILLSSDWNPSLKNTCAQGTIRKEQLFKWTNMEAGTSEEYWEVRDNRGALIELRVQYQGALPLRGKAEQKLYSAVEPAFYRIYRQETVGDLVKSLPAGVDRIKSYRFNVSLPNLSRLFNGTEQVVGIVSYPLYLRQVFLP